jgi:hypothetical protein
MPIVQTMAILAIKADNEENYAEDNQGAPDMSPPSGHGGSRGTNADRLSLPT